MRAMSCNMIKFLGEKITIYFPQLEGDINNMVKEWDTQLSLPFKIKGKNVLELFREQWESFDKFVACKYKADTI